MSVSRTPVAKCDTVKFVTDTVFPVTLIPVPAVIPDAPLNCTKDIGSVSATGSSSSYA